MCEKKNKSVKRIQNRVNCVDKTLTRNDNRVILEREEMKKENK